MSFTFENRFELFVLVCTGLVLVSSRVWLVRTLAPDHVWARAVLAVGMMQGVDAFTWVFIAGSRLAQLVCAVPGYAVVLMMVYGRNRAATFSFSAALSVSALIGALHGLIALAVVYGFMIYAGAPMLVGGLVIAGLAMVLGIRWLNASRARALAARMRGAGLDQGASGNLS